MNRLVIIGNGFDLAHGLETRYEQFVRWYIDDFFRKLFDSKENISYHNDELLDIKLFSKQHFTFNFPNRTFVGSVKSAYSSSNDVNSLEFLKILENIIKSQKDSYTYEKKSEFLERILKNIESKGWTDIERDYYALLKENADNIEACKSLNVQLDYLREKLLEYLDEQKSDIDLSNVKRIFLSNIKEEDIAQSSKDFIKPFVSDITFDNQQDKGYEIERTMFLDFNYTSTSDKYKNDDKFSVNHIHGSLSNPKQMIFGYGDEMDKDFQELEDKNENELLKNNKSIKYLEDNNYRQFLQFIEGDPFQVFIMGHSCGISDRTLLNTIFEHKNCISIKPFYYKWGKNEGEDNYLEISQNIYRNFKNKALFRDRVVNKTKCELMPQMEKVSVSKK